MTTFLEELPAEPYRPGTAEAAGHLGPGIEAGRLRVKAWVDPLIDALGHDPRSLYVERYWLPVLGPSTTWMLRRFAEHLDCSPEGVELEVQELACALGIGGRYGQNAPFARTLKRCVDFQMAEWRGSALAVRRHLPPLAGRHLKRLPETLRARHSTEILAPTPTS
ncbi:MAG: hypothetical protein ACRDZ5_05870 [Acidimicrobiales bacterium]